MPVKRGMQDAESQISAVPTGEASADGRKTVEAAGLCVHRGWAAAAVSVHPGLGLGSDGRCSAHLRRVGAARHLQEVKSMRVRMVCIRLPRFVGSAVRKVTGKRRM